MNWWCVVGPWIATLALVPTLLGGAPLRPTAALAAVAGSRAGTPPPVFSQQVPVPIFEEAFANNQAGWPENDFRYFAEDGYHIVGEQRETATIFPIQPRLSPRAADGALEVELIRVDGRANGWLGVSFRSTTTPRRYYRVLIDDNGRFSLDRVTDGSTAALISARRAASLVPGNAANVIRLIGRGKTLSVVFNGQQAGCIEDDGIPEEGAIQVLVGDGVHGIVRRVTVAAPSEQELRPPAAPIPLLQDHFFDNRSGWPVNDFRYFDEAGYHVLVDPQGPPGLYSLTPRATPFATDMALEAELRLVDGSESMPFGIALRTSATPNRSYRLSINGEGSFRLDRATEEGTVSLLSWQRSQALKTGSASNTLRLVARGNALMVYLNGQLAGSVQDDAITAAGQIRLLISHGQHVVVRSLLVVEPSAQETVPSASPPQPAPGTAQPPPAASPSSVPAPAPSAPVPAATPAPRSAGQWREHTSLEGGFSALLPDAGTPVTQNSTTNTPFGSIVSHELVLYVDEGSARVAYGLTYVDYPESVIRSLEPTVFLKRVRDGIVSVSGGKVLSESPIVLGGYPGLEFTAELRGGELYARMRAFLVNRRVYVASVSTPGETVSFEKVSRFLDSFKLLTPPPTPPPPSSV